VGDISVAHLGNIDYEFADDELEQLKDIDILLVPVGTNLKQAVKIVNELQPRIVIPMHYKLPELKSDLLPVDKFLKEVGAKSETLPKIKISKKDLPQEEMKVVILTKD
jgi:L-ascorbate metabolism protein UlaG (beta-lactamase superfamily)